MDPGTISGAVSLEAPPPEAGGRAVLDALFHGTDGRPDGIPDPNGNLNQPCGILGEAAASPEGMARSQTDFSGDTGEGSDSIRGDYSLRLGWLHRGEADWHVPQLRLAFADESTPDVPDSYVWAKWLMTDEPAPWINVAPASAASQDLRACATTWICASPSAIVAMKEKRGL